MANEPGEVKPSAKPIAMIVTRICLLTKLAMMFPEDSEEKATLLEHTFKLAALITKIMDRLPLDGADNELLALANEDSFWSRPDKWPRGVLPRPEVCGEVH